MTSLKTRAFGFLAVSLAACPMAVHVLAAPLQGVTEHD